MSATGLEVFDRTLQATNIWLDEVMQEADWADRHKAYSALRVVLHALRDRLPVDEASHLSAQLPMLLRGVFFEGWHPAGTPVRLRRFTLSLLKQHPGKDSLAMKRRICGWSDDFLMEVPGIKGT